MLALVPGSASAAQPSGDTGSATITGATTATLSGYLNPGTYDATYYFEYAPARNHLCGGTDVSAPEQTTALQLSAIEGAQDVSASISGLTAGENYCFQLFASNSDGPAQGLEPVDFVAGAPTAITSDARVTGAGTATIDGTANASGQSAGYQVLYDQLGSSWCNSVTTDQQPATSPHYETTPAVFPYDDTSFHNVSVELGDLTFGTSYCAVLQMSVAGVDSSLLSAGYVELTAGAPTVTTQTAVATGATTATISGSVDPNGQAASYWAEYDVDGTSFCGDGSGTTPPSSTPATSGLSSDQAVSVTLTGLTPGQDYCAEIVAGAGGVSNLGAVNNADTPVAFTSGVPLADTTSAVSTSDTTATVTGDVDQSGDPTTAYYIEYDQQGSEFCTDGVPDITTDNTMPGVSGGLPAPANSSSNPVSVHLTNLVANRSYCAEIIATNSSGSSTDAISNFVTPVPRNSPVSFTPGVPYVTTDLVTPGSTTATVEGEVDPDGQTASTSYWVEYDADGTSFCGDGSDDTAPISTPATSGLTGEQTVSVELTGLAPNGSYCAALVAQNSTGSYESSPVTFTETPGSGGPPPSGNTTTPAGTTPSAITTPGSGATPGAPTTPGGGATTAANSPRPACTIANTSSAVVLRKPKKGKLKTPLDSIVLQLTCSQTSSATLTGSFSARVKRRTETFSLASLHVSLKARAGRSVTIRLVGGAVRVLTTGGTLTASLKLKATDHSGTGIATKSLKLHGSG